MIEGWQDSDYLLLFEEQNEAVAMTERYGLERLLPGYTILGMKGWDDFILRDCNNQLFTIPTVPIDKQYLQSFCLSIDLSTLVPDERLRNKIKWYIKPLVFGGDPKSEENIAWISLDQHVEAVAWWNHMYRDLRQQKNGKYPAT